MGASRYGVGAKFLSERFYALVAGGEDIARGMKSSQLALLAQGKSYFKDSLFVQGESATIAVFFPINPGEVIAAGDVLCANNTDERLKKSNMYTSPSVMGVVVSEAAIVLNPPSGVLPSEKDNKGKVALISTPADYALVAIMGVAKVNALVHRGQAPIVPGDLLVSSHKPGYLESYKEGVYKPGIIVAKSLSALEEEEGQIRVLLANF